MSYSTEVRVGSPRRLLKNWIDTIRTIRQRQSLAPVVTLVPNYAVARFLETRLSREFAVANVRVVTLWDWARELLPPAAVLPPVGFEQIVAGTLPGEVRRSLPENVPGLYVSAIEAGLECRRQHIPRDRLDELEIGWAPVVDWLDGVFTGHLFDEFRVYRWALDHLADVAPPPVPWLVYGFADAHPGQGALLSALAGRDPLILWVPDSGSDGGLADDWMAVWRRRGARVSRLADEAAPAVVRTVEIPDGTDMLDVIFQVIGDAAGRAGYLSGDVLVVTPAGEWDERLVVRGRRLGMPLAPESGLPGRFERELWRIFLQVATGTALRPETLVWLEYHGAALPGEEARRLAVRGSRWKQELGRFGLPTDALRWAAEWGRRLRRAGSWSQMAEEVEAASRYHAPADWGRLVRIADSWRVLDEVGLPVPHGIVMDLLWRIDPAPDGPRDPGGMALVRASSAGLLTYPLVVVAGVEDGRLPRRPPPDPLLPDGLREALGLPGSQQIYRQETERLALIARAAADEVWMLGRGRWPAVVRELGVAHPWQDLPAVVEPRAPLASGAREWYAAHRDGGRFTAFTGDIGPELAQQFFPRTDSPSSVERFGACPFAYFLRYGLGLEAVDDETETTVTPAVWGQWGHRALELLGADEARGSAAEVRARLAAAVEQVVRLAPPGPAVLPTVVAAVKERLVSELTEAVWDYRDDDIPVKTRTEVPCTWTVEVGGSRWRFEGRIDRVDWYPDGKVRIVDYKTGGMTPPDRILPDNLQLVLYHEGLSQSGGHDPGRVGAALWGISQKNEFGRLWLTRAPADAYQDAHRILEAVASRIRAGRFYPAPNPKADPCRRCEFRPVCPRDIRGEATRMGAEDPEFISLWVGTPS